MYSSGGPGGPNSWIDPDELLKFFEHVLPPTGLYCAAIKRAGRAPDHVFAATIEELCQIVLTSDRPGQDVYFALASFKDAEKGRKGANAKAYKCFWVELDCGKEGHAEAGYPDIDTALRALHAFCEQAELPYPMPVVSGGGWHAYWPLKETLSPEEWKPYAEALKVACQALGLKADPSATADLARILRPPGTTNRKLKGNPRTVVLDPSFLKIEPYDPAQFEPLLKHSSGGMRTTKWQLKLLPGGAARRAAEFKIGPRPEELKLAGGPLLLENAARSRTYLRPQYRSRGRTRDR